MTLAPAVSQSAPAASPASSAFTSEQKEYLDGMLAGLARLRPPAFPDGTSGPPAASQQEETFHGFPLSELCRQELWKHAEHGLDGWERLLRHAREGTLPGEEDSFRFRFFGLFNVSPTQESLMLRCRIPAGELTAAQLQGMAAIAEEFGDGGTSITTRSNLQIRGIHPRDSIKVLVRLQALGLTARGSGVDNVRNITASPTAGIDAQELIDVRPFAHDLHHYILNHRDLYDLPRKFNVAFDGGGRIDTLADTNDIGFMAVRTPQDCTGQSLRDGSPAEVPAGIWFRIELAGITGHRQLAADCGVVVSCENATAVAAAMLRVFSDHGDRTDRKKARLKYLIDSWGVEKFLTETQRRLSFDLIRLDSTLCEARTAAVKHAHLGFHPQKQPGLHYAGVVIPVGLLTAAQMRSLAAASAEWGSGMLRLTPWQNLIIPDVREDALTPLREAVEKCGLSVNASHASGGLVACTGNRGCKYAAADTKGDAVAIGQWLDSRLELPLPVNIHLTGCPHSCAQHYVGDIGLQAVKVEQDGTSVSGYNIVVGGGTGAEAAIGRLLKQAVPATEAPAIVTRILQSWIARRLPGETFNQTMRRMSDAELSTLLSA